MSIRQINKDSEAKETDSEVKEIYNYGIKIQCPGCGSIFILNEYGEYFCRCCNRIYLESEIREHCGL